MTRALFTHRLARLRNLSEEESGAAILEFAVSAAILMMTVLGIVDCSRAIYADNFVCYSAHAAARYAMVRGATWSGTSCASVTSDSCQATQDDVANFVRSQATAGIMPSPTYLTVTSTWPGTSPGGTLCGAAQGASSPGCVVQVNVTYSFNFLFPFLPKDTLSLSSTSAMAISQ